MVERPMLFDDGLKDEQFMTAVEKRVVLRHWAKFLKNGLRWQDFSKQLYHHLMQHCSFIAHYDRHGFYGTYFTSGDGKEAFLSQFDRRNAGPDGIPRSVEYGMTYWAKGDYSDVNVSMIEIAAGYIPQLLESARKQQRDADLAAARALLERHNVKMVI
jgi:hypothetical protein